MSEGNFWFNYETGGHEFLEDEELTNEKARELIPQNPRWQRRYDVLRESLSVRDALEQIQRERLDELTGEKQEL